MKKRRDQNWVLLILLVLFALGILGVRWAKAECVTPPNDTPRLLTMQEIMDLPYGTRVWVEYNREVFDLIPDEGMTRERTDKGEVLCNADGYWTLEDDYSFGSSHRVWTDRPTKAESDEIPWDESPW